MIGQKYDILIILKMINIGKFLIYKDSKEEQMRLENSLCKKKNKSL